MEDADSDEAQYQRLRQWAAVIQDANYYEILGVLELADTRSIQLAFHQFALAFHPDCHIHAPDDVQGALRYIYRMGAEAYRVLADPTARAKYDMAVARGLVRFDGDGSAPARRSEEMSARPGAKSLEDVCNTPAARLCARRADEYISSGSLDQAKRALREALAHDGNENPELEERIEALEMAIFAMGGG